MCNCPAINLYGPDKSVNSGDSVIFVVKVAGGKMKKPLYSWSVINGTIFGGQNTPQIIVKPDSNKDNVTAKVKIDGTDPRCDCPVEVSKIVSVNSEKP